MAEEANNSSAPANGGGGGGAAATAAPLGSSVIPMINKLQDVCAQLPGNTRIDLPQVAVVGSQSCGKSSVLEALVGRDFLPRGSDICTRRPLILQLVQTKRRNDGTEEEWGEFLHLQGTKFNDFSKIRREIEDETERDAGENKGVSDMPIRLKISSPNVLDITLVDLPGITKVPVGDQPSDIEAQIRTMIMTYIIHPSCLILAVTPANSDLANSDALQIAGNADPDGHRTIGVITKLDIMDRGTDARNLLLGEVIPLKLGYVGVVNRCQEDIMLNRSVKDALVAEDKFFRNRPVYNSVADQCGIPQLAKKLNQILVQHINKLLPGLKSEICFYLVAVAKEHSSLGEIVESKAGQGALLLNILSKYSEAFASMIEGKNKEMLTSELSGGARIHYIFQNIFVKSLEEVDPCEDLTDEDIRTAIQNAAGPRPALFVSEVPFEVLIRRQIARLLDPSLQCAKFIYDELVKISHRCMISELQRFPRLRKRMDEVMSKFLQEGLAPSEAMIDNLIEMEMDYINTSHPNFIGGSKALELAMQQAKSNFSITIYKHKVVHTVVAEVEKAAPSGNTNGSTWGISAIFRGGSSRVSVKESPTSELYGEPVRSIEHAMSMILLKEAPSILRPPENQSDQEGIEIAVTKLLLRSYYDIVRKNIEDAVPKAIMHFMVNHTKRELHNVFIKVLYREDLFEDMLQEPDEVAMKRRHTRETLKLLQQALQTLDELPREAETVERGYNYGNDPTGLPKMYGLPSSSSYSTSNRYNETYSPSRRNSKFRNSPSHSGELHPTFYGNAESNTNVSCASAKCATCQGFGSIQN